MPRSTIRGKSKGVRARWARVGVIVVLGAGVLGGCGGIFYLGLTRPHEHRQASRLFIIRPGATARQIVHQLHEADILSHPFLVLTYLTLSHSSSRLKAGEYRFPSPISPLQVIRKLTAGQVSARRVTFPEGLTRFDVAAIISRLPLKDAHRALALTQDPSLVSDLDPEADSLEGYLFPDTYEYVAHTTAAELMARMVARFRQVFTPEYEERAKELGLTVREVVTLASLIEKEARIPAERPLISSVFHNRLRRGMKLDCDPTVAYAALLAGKNHPSITKSDLLRESPYNTYLTPGLPPGPIASPGRSSIEAALFPQKSNYLYFVLDGTKNDGSHRFAADLAQHKSNVTLYRQRQ